MIFRALATLLMTCAVLSACATPTVSAPVAADDLVGGAGTGQDYHLGVGDKLRVIVFNEESLSGEFQVSADGTVSLPLIGAVRAMDQTPSALSATIRAQLAQGYLRDPRVSVEVLTYRPFFILGEVKTPAQYPYVNGLTVVNAIATAGGYTPRAQRKIAYIRRAGEDQERAYKLTPDLIVRPGDTIRLGERLF